jgi:hypothetical protein
VDADRVIMEAGPGDAIQIRCPTPFIQINTTRQASLRLNDPHYVFPEAPDLRAMTGAAVQLDFLRDHLNGYCDLWRKPQKLFLDSYFEFINARVADAQATLAAALEKFGDLYDVQDWALSAPRPIPRALIRRPNGDGSYTPVDFAFWFNGRIVVVLLVGTGTPTRADRNRRASLESAGVGGSDIEIVDISVQALQRDGADYLSTALPIDFGMFWEGEAMPSSPFKGATLGEIIPAPTFP